MSERVRPEVLTRNDMRGGTLTAGQAVRVSDVNDLSVKLGFTHYFPPENLWQEQLLGK